jgi:AsmA protein
MSVGRLARWALGVGVALVALLGAALLIVPWLVDTPRIQAYIAGAAAQALGRPVKFSGVSLRVLPLPAVVLHDLEVAEDPRFGAAPFLRLKSGRIRLRLRPLLAGRVELGAIVLDQPVVTIVQAADGRLNVSTLGAASPSRAAGRAGEAGRSGAGAAGVGLAISRVSIEGGALTWIARGAGQAESRYRVEDLDLTVTGGGGHFALHGSGRVQPGALAVTVSDGVVTLSGARPLTEAALRGRVALASSRISRRWSRARRRRSAAGSRARSRSAARSARPRRSARCSWRR